MAYSFEIGPIRPPSESNSLLIRATRNCAWNRCKFCISYPDQPFQIRNVSDIKRDISIAKMMRDKILEITYKSGTAGGMQKVVGMVLKDPPNESFRNVALWLYGGGENVFLQDSDNLVMKTDDFGQVITYLKETFPRIKRITSYARSQTAKKKKAEELVHLRQAGLNRLHIGLESGYDPILERMNKGETASDHVKGGRKVIEAGISLSEYVILGLGGRDLSLLHAQHTAKILNEINPEFIRVRTLFINPKMPLFSDVASGKFIRATDEEIIHEERTLIENLNVNSRYVSDHVSNLLPELEGNLPSEKNKLLSILSEFERLPLQEKINFIVGRRVGLYKTVKDIQDGQKHDLVDQIRFKLSKGERILDPKVIFSLMEEFV